MHVVAVGTQERDDDRLADVVHVALDGADDDGALRLRGALGERGVADFGGARHGVGREHELRQEHLAPLEEVTHLRDAGDEAELQHVVRSDTCGQRPRGHVGGLCPVAGADRVHCLLVEVFVCHAYDLHRSGWAEVRV